MRTLVCVVVLTTGAALALSSIVYADSATPAEPTSGGKTDADFLTGLKRLGALAGQSVECAPEASRQEEVEKVAGIGNDIAVEYGLRASFNFIGAAGFGAGKQFDKSTCSKIVIEWKAVEDKYGEK